MMLAEIVYLRENIAKGLSTATQRLCTRQHQRFVQIAQGFVRRLYRRQFATAVKELAYCHQSIFDSMGLRSPLNPVR